MSEYAISFMMKNIRIAICQIICLDGDRSGNFVRIENALAQAVKAGADIACFPETAILGWVNPDAHQRAYPIPGKDTERLGVLARKYKVHICIGLAEKDGDNLYDSAVLIDDKGKILLNHRKINILTELMTPAYTPGANIGVAETKFGSIGILICADTFREEVLAQMRALKPDVVLVPYGWAAPEEKWPDHGKSLQGAVRNAAKKINATVIGTDVVGQISHGPWAGQVYGGQSVACNKEQNVLAACLDRDRDMQIVTVKQP